MTSVRIARTEEHPQVRDERPRIALKIQIRKRYPGRHEPYPTGGLSAGLQRALYAIDDQMHAWLAHSSRNIALFLTDPVAAIHEVAPELTAQHRAELERLREKQAVAYADIPGVKLSKLELEVVS
jgi:hypothetical protein